MTIYSVDPLSDPRWPDLVSTHPDASVFHTRGWLQALQQTYGYKPVVFTTCAPSAQLSNGIICCMVKTWLTGHRLVSLPFSDHCNPLVDNPVDSFSILAFLQKEFTNSKWQYIEIRPRIPTLMPTEFRESESFCFHSLDLRPSTEQLFRAFQTTSIQQRIRRAEREKLTYDAGRSEFLLRSFYNLLVASRRRQGLPPQPERWFRNLIAHFGDRLDIHVAFMGDRPLASILTLCHSRVLVYKYGCSDHNGRKSGGTQLLLWEAIKKAKNNQIEELDLGRSDYNNPGLIAFKERWGATKSKLAYFRYSARPHQFRASASWKLSMTKSIVARLPVRVLEAAGTVMYKHIG